MTTDDEQWLDRLADAEGWTVLLEGFDQARSLLSTRLVATYALGSLAHDGFSPAVSDVDLALIVGSMVHDPAPICEAIRERVAKKIATPLASRLSIFWSSWPELATPAPRGRFPLVDRIDLLDAGVCVYGVDRRGEVALPLGEARRDALVIEAAEFMLAKLATPERDALLKDPDALMGAGAREVTKAVLFPVRFLYTAATGRVDGNGPAVAFYGEGPSTPARKLANSALSWRAGALSANAEPLLRAGLRPLYGEMLEIYVAQCQRLRKVDLAKALARWRARLLRDAR